MDPLDAHFIPFPASTRMSGVDVGVRKIRKGAADAVRAHVDAHGGAFPAVDFADRRCSVGRRGSTPLVVADGHTAYLA